MSNDDDNAAPKKAKGFVFSQLPGATGDTSLGPTYLYEVRTSDMDAYTKAPSTEPAASKFRTLLERVASLTSSSKGVKDAGPLAPEEAAKLTDEEIEKLAEAYLGTLNMQSYATTASKSTPAVTRSPDEAASSFVDRLINWYVPHARAELMKLFEGVGGKSAQSLAKAFDQSLRVDNSIEQFRRTQETFERQRKSYFDSVSRATSEGVGEALAQQVERQSRERAEEMELTRQIQEMTAESTEMLRDLAKAATEFIAQFDATSKKNDRAVKFSTWIAVGSLLVLAGLAIASYRQDSHHISSLHEQLGGLTQEARRGNELLDREVQQLTVANDELRRRIVALEAAYRAQLEARATAAEERAKIAEEKARKASPPKPGTSSDHK